MHRNFSGIIWGLIFIALGTIMLLDRFNYLDFNLGHFLATWWPMILIIIGLGMIFDRASDHRGK
jgi:lia operon protein LiaF